MNEIQKRVVDATISQCFSSSSEQFKSSARATLSSFVESRNHGSPPRSQYLSQINRSIWSTYNTLLNQIK
jgi:hypothetical protein